MGIAIPNVFVSSERVDDSHVMGLISRLRQEGYTVSHSPRNPADGEDPRWRAWYESGCRAEVAQADVFLIGVTRGWDCSTWMCHEAEEARLSGRIRRRCYYNPAHIAVKENMAWSYLNERLPDDLGEAVASLKKD